MKSTLYIPLLILLLFSMSSFGQEVLPRPKRILEIGPAISSYKGDLSSGFSKVGGGVNLGYIFNNNKRWQIRFDFSYLYLQGQKVYSPSYIPPLDPPYPNTFFQSHTLNSSLSFMFNIINSRYFKLYVAQGIGLFYFNPLDENGEEYIEQDYTNASEGIFATRNEGETYTNFAFSMPTRIGAYYYLKNNFGFGLSVTFVNPFTDYLDNISQLGVVDGNDQAMSINFSFLIPLSYRGKLKAVDIKE